MARTLLYNRTSEEFSQLINQILWRIALGFEEAFLGKYNDMGLSKTTWGNSIKKRLGVYQTPSEIR